MKQKSQINDNNWKKISNENKVFCSSLDFLEVLSIDFYIKYK